MATKKERKRFSFTDMIKEYIAVKIDYLELLLVEKIALIVGKLTLKVIFGVFCFLIFCFVLLLIYQLLMLCIGVAWLVSLIEIGILLLLMWIAWIFREKLIIIPVTDSVVRILANSVPKKKKVEEEDNEDD